MSAGQIISAILLFFAVATAAATAVCALLRLHERRPCATMCCYDLCAADAEFRLRAAMRRAGRNGRVYAFCNDKEAARICEILARGNPFVTIYKSEN